MVNTNIIDDFKTKLNDNITKSLDENRKNLAKIYSNLEIIVEITNCLENDTLIILKEVIHDLISGLYSGLQALYRNAYISMRSAIELSLAYIFFLDHNYEYLFWKCDKYDIKWSKLEDKETGVLNKDYLGFFCNDNLECLFNSCRKVYRDCSQFVHGKYEYMYTIKQQKIEYNQTELLFFLDMHHELTNIIISLLLIRHNNQKLKINESYKSVIEENLKNFHLLDTIEKVKEFWT